MGTLILAHRDADGVCSSALALSARPGARLYFSHPIGLHEDLQRAMPGEEALVFDISLAENTAHKTLASFERLNEMGSLTYFDHHPLPPGGTERDIPCILRYDARACSIELAFLEFKSQISGDMSRVTICGAMGDYREDTPLIQRLVNDWDKSALYYEAGTLLEALEIARARYDFMRRMAYHLASERLPSSDEEAYARARRQAVGEEQQRIAVREASNVIGNIAYVLDAPGSIGTAAFYARVSKGSLVGIAGETRGENVDLSLRTSMLGLNLNTILREECKRFGGVGGGHPHATGARIPASMLMSFLVALERRTRVSAGYLRFRSFRCQGGGDLSDRRS